ncbi:MAG: phospho-N-acetylmuramoyl-pentapeptide-transferase [Clostridia bacterium]|nr:phospho-N-acetylmuramoyl-pentapeptide-transferase [Clostridia bacterium]MBP3559574.1 phospho-N-acetylmuramoyl-pentapeptide-transferase [Clostridia bacterium]
MKIIIACIVAAIIAFGISFGLGYIVIPFLHKIKFGQTILDIGPKWHKNKQGTPTMGGILFIVGTVVAFGVVLVIDKLLGGNIIEMNDIVADSMRVKIYGGLIMALGFAFIGFLDDYIKVVKKRNKGLSIIQKTVLQIVLMVGYLLTLYMNDPTGSMFIPFVGMVETKIFFWVIGIGVIYCTTNAVNFTDGIDGLCGSVTFTAALSFIAIAALRNCFGISLLASALAGGLIGYLVWNWHPAKVMMGDLGSMFLGGMIVAFSYAVDCPFIILLTGIIYVAEFGSDVLQIGYFKLTHGKRIFKMAPIHHHFEMCGWKEVKIVKIFSIVNLIGGIIAVLLVYFGNLK